MGLRSAARGVVGRVRDMGGALVGVVRAEISSLLAELASSGRSLVRSLVLFALAFAFGFWTLGLLVYFLVELLALRLARWGAVGIVFALFLLTALALGAWSLSRLKRIESPVATLDRRLKNHLTWWQQRVVAEADTLADGVEPFEEDELD